jgi:hypothetical protein
MRFLNIALVGIAAACVSNAVAQEDKKDERPYFGIKVGFFMPSNGETRDMFGSTVFAFGISMDDFSRQPDKWRLTADIDFITGRHDPDDNDLFPENKFFALPLTASIGRVFGADSSKMRPYVRIGAGVAYMDYSVTRPSTGERFSAKRGVPTANAEAGIFISDRIRVAARYDWFAKVDEFDFSGLQLTATFNLIRF